MLSGWMMAHGCDGCEHSVEVERRCQVRATVSEGRLDGG